MLSQKRLSSWTASAMPRRARCHATPESTASLAKLSGLCHARAWPGTRGTHTRPRAAASSLCHTTAGSRPSVWPAAHLPHLAILSLSLSSLFLRSAAQTLATCARGLAMRAGSARRCVPQPACRARALRRVGSFARLVRARPHNCACGHQSLCCCAPGAVRWRRRAHSGSLVRSC